MAWKRSRPQLRAASKQSRRPKRIGIKQHCKNCCGQGSGSRGYDREDASGDLYGKSQSECREWETSEGTF
jgi:hypothetical protein